MKRTALGLGVIALAALAGIGLYAHDQAAPGCDSEPALHQVYDLLRDQFHLDSVFLNAVTSQSGGVFSHHRDCVAQVTQIKGNVKMADLPWREIHYRIVQQDASRPAVITVEMGDLVPMDESKRSIWARLLALF